MITLLMCQQGIPFRVSPARTQMIQELKKRGSEIVIFFPGRILDKELKSQTKKIVNTKWIKKSEIRKKILEIQPSIVICFTIEDTKICFPLPYLMKKTDFYYYNLEIYVLPFKRNEDRFFKRIIKHIDYFQNKLKEMGYVRGCKGLVIQDQLRKKILNKYWISHSNTWLIPNSYYKNRCKYEVIHENGIIYSGSMGLDVLESFIEHIHDFDNVSITLSGWDGANKKIQGNSNIKVIKHNLTQEEYTKFISIYDIALIWYSNLFDDNVYNIGLASGKFFKHLSIGQPVIVNNVPGLADEVKKYNLGVVIDDLSELEEAVKKIRRNYKYYVKNIEEIYANKYDYKKVSKKFFDFIIYKAAKKEKICI